MNWSRAIARSLIALPGTPYGALQRLRQSAYSVGLLRTFKAPIPVLSVGNLVHGGSGKTPLVIWLAQKLRSIGFSPAVVSRGYGGSNREPFAIVSDGSSTGPHQSPKEVGDEPFLIASRLQGVPVLVGRKRIHPVMAAADLLGCNVAVLDDGFQHLSLERDLNLLIVLGSEPHLLPLVDLREPLWAIKRADALMLQEESSVSSTRDWMTDVPIFRFGQRPVGLVRDKQLSEMISPTALAGHAVQLVSAIARPERFAHTAQRLGWDVVAHTVHCDHHFFSDEELERILTMNPSADIVCTEKDWVKLPDWFLDKDNTWALRIDAEIEDAGDFMDFVTRRIAPCASDNRHVSRV